MTVGEKAFAAYLESCGLSYAFEKQHAGRQKRPDFTVNHKGMECFFDVKDRTELRLGDGPYDPYRWFREQISQGGRKFREFKGSVCAVVLCPANAWSSDFENPDIMLGSMYGNLGLMVRRTKADGSSAGFVREEWGFLNDGKMIRPHWKTAQHTTISALVSLRNITIGQARLLAYAREQRRRGDSSYSWLHQHGEIDVEERCTGVIVWENAFAVRKFPPDLFIGTYDERWSAVDGSMRRTHIGAGLVEFERLRGSSG